MREPRGTPAGVEGGGRGGAGGTRRGGAAGARRIQGRNPIRSQRTVTRALALLPAVPRQAARSESGSLIRSKHACIVPPRKSLRRLGSSRSSASP